MRRLLTLLAFLCAELFSLPSWVAVMLGQNIWPQRHDPIADTLDPAKVAAAMAQMRESYRATAARLPSQEAFMRQAGAWNIASARRPVTSCPASNTRPPLG